MARVVMQLGRLTLLDQPLAMDVHGLDFHSSRGPTCHLARRQLEMSSSPANMGTNSANSPSSMDFPLEEDDSLSLDDIAGPCSPHFDMDTGHIVSTRSNGEQRHTRASPRGSRAPLVLLHGLVSPLVVSPPGTSLPPVATNASLGLRDPPGPVEPLPCEKYVPPTSGCHSASMEEES